ncbi:MAG: hypothetical protein AB7S46_13970, partial [Flavobacteriaceae bacterium]
ERLREYLHSLPASVRSRLAAVAREAVASGQADPALKLIAGALAGPGPLPPESVRIGPVPPVAVRFSDCLAPFISTARSAIWVKGYLTQQTASRLWGWLLAHAGDETATALSQAERAVSLDAAQAADIRLFARMADDVETAMLTAKDDRTRAFQIQTELGSGDALRELADLAVILRSAPQLERLRWLLPQGIEKLDDRLSDELMQLLVTVPADRLWVAAERIAAAFSVPARVAVMAMRLEGTDNAQRIARGRWAAIVDVAIAQVVMSADRVTAARDWGELDAFLDDVRQGYLAIQTLTRSVEIETWSPWRERIAECRKRISDRLGSELAELPATLRRTIRAYVGGDGAAQVDEGDVEDVLRKLHLLYALKTYRGELAVNELVDRMLRLVEPLMENANQSLLSLLRSSPGPHRERAAAGFDTLMKCSVIVFGEEYAALLRRSAHMASDGLVRDVSREAPALVG